MEKLGETLKKKREEDGGATPRKRASGSETIVYLREKAERDFDLRKEELETRKRDQTQQLQMFQYMQQQLQQQQQQQQQMQLQRQQEQLQNQLLMTLIEKLSRELTFLISAISCIANALQVSFMHFKKEYLIKFI